MYRKNILIYIQQNATLHSLFYLETALHVSGGTTTLHQERTQLYLQHLVFVRPLLLLMMVVVTPESCRALYSYFSIQLYKIWKNIPVYIKQDATLHSLFYLKTALHVSGGTTL